MNKKSMILVLAILVMSVFLTGCQQLSMAGDGASKGGITIEAAGTCPEDGDTSLTLALQNMGNETGIEVYNAEYTLIGSEGSKVTGTETNGTTAITLNCGEKYTLSIESADGASGDNARILKVLSGQGATLNSDGTVSFTPSKSSYNLRIGAEQHATLEFKAYDNSGAAWAFDTGDVGATDFETDGVVYTNGDNTTGFTLTSVGDFVDMTFNVRAVQTDTEFCDMGCLIAIEAPVTEYDEPTVKFEGKKLVDIKGTLNAQETKQLSNYEYVYEVAGPINHKISQLDFYIEGNADASTDVEIDFLARGRVDSINGVDLLVSSAQDDSSATTVYAIQDTSITIT